MSEEITKQIEKVEGRNIDNLIQGDLVAKSFLDNFVLYGVIERTDTQNQSIPFGQYYLIKNGNYVHIFKQLKDDSFEYHHKHLEIF